MRWLLILTVAIVIGVSAAGTAMADIYVWTDENGVKHITNQDPPDDAKILMRTPEIPYDAAADRQRRETERQERLAREKRELAEREAEVARREREAKARLEAAEQFDREMRAYQQGMEDQDRYDDDNDRSYWYGGSLWYRDRLGYPDYYRKDGSIYYKKRNPHRKNKLKPGLDRGHFKKSDDWDGKYMLRRHRYKSNAARVPQPSARTPYRAPHAYHRDY